MCYVTIIFIFCLKGVFIIVTMGIFGGFKAKFTRNSRSKDYLEPIICTKYKINSEFEDDGRYHN